MAYRGSVGISAPQNLAFSGVYGGELNHRTGGNMCISVCPCVIREICVCKGGFSPLPPARLSLPCPPLRSHISGQNWPSRRVTLSDVKKSRGKRRYSRVCASTSRASLCQNVKVTHIRNRRNVRVYDNNCIQRRQKIAHIFSKK